MYFFHHRFEFVTLLDDGLADLCHHLFRGIRFSRVVDHYVEAVPREGQSDRSADTT
jgi:hypothetical protein